MAEGAQHSTGALRLDKFLWFVRLTKTRGAAQALAEAGHVRLDGRRVDRAHACVRVGSVLSLPHGAGARVLRVEALPSRRGSYPEACACYTSLAEPGLAEPGAREPALTSGARGD